MYIKSRSEQPALTKRILIFSLALILAAGYPFAVMASTQESTTNSDQPETSQEAVPAESKPAETTKKEEKPKLTYTYNTETKRWDSEKWKYNPDSGKYEKHRGPIIIEPDSKVDSTTKQDDTTTVDTDINIENEVTSDATSGDSTVESNTKGGDAVTGDASTVATLVNVANSSVTNGNNQKVANFTQDILGDVKGDIILHPLLLKAMLEAEVEKNTSASTINVNNDLNINNNIDLTAKSGDATVASNTEAGDAKTGSAHAVANVVNILNSMIAAQESFIGTINIYGNLEGDILIAPDFIPQMIASNGSDDSDIKVSKQDTSTIVNNISAVAESGAASVFGNTNGGDALTGDADSNVVIFNVSGHDIIAKNSLLVFVNVLGKWVGVIVDAPEGATAAMIGNGVTSHTEYEPDLTINTENNHGITNTIAVNAQSGDALVSNNTTAGNAISGQATAMANVANISGSQIGLTDWFGVLFINVFQNWHGSFGINTPYGDSLAPDKDSNTQKPSGPIEFVPAKNKVNKNNVRVKIIDSRLISAASAAVTEIVSAAQSSIGGESDKAILSAQSNQDTSSEPVTEYYDYRLWIIAGSILLIGGSVIGMRRMFR